MQESLFNNDAGFSPQLYYEKILTQESSLAIFKHAFLWNTPSTPYYEARQARHLVKQAKHANFSKHAKHAILWSTPSTPTFWSMPSTPFHEALQARKHAKHTST